MSHMDEMADAPDATRLAEAALLSIEGVDVIPFTDVVRRLRADYPAIAATRIEAVLLREWEAFTAGRPLVVPAAVEAGAREILEQPAG
jgi:hypothetical protein